MKKLFKLFDFIPSAAYPVISEYAKILIPALITYLVTRYSLKNPHKYKIKEKQFELVYLPLYLLTQQYIAELNRDTQLNLQIYTKKVEKLIYKNYPYVYPKTLRLFKELKAEIIKSKINIYFIENFKYQVDTDYVKLKRELNYPCDSIISLFKRLNILDKWFFITNLLLFTMFIFSIVSLIICLFKGEFFNMLPYILCIIASSFLIYLFYNIKKH